MTTATTTPQVFKSQFLTDAADMIKAAGLKVYWGLWKHTTSKPTYFYFTDGVNIGYCQEAYFGGIQFSTVHRPCRECGTGFGLSDDRHGFTGEIAPTIETAKQAFIKYPNWATSSDRKAVVKYKNWEEYAAKNNSCEYVEY